jgi:hypothetical protein
MRRTLAVAYLSFAGLVSAACSGAEVVPLPTLAVLPSASTAPTEFTITETPLATPSSTGAQSSAEASAEITAAPTTASSLVAQGALTFWQPVAGDLNEGESHIWEFAAQAGDPIQARVIGPATLSLLSSSGDVVTSGDDARTALPTSGVYRILVEPQPGAACPCHYELGLSYTDRPNPAAIVPSEAAPIIGIPTPTPPPYIDLGTFGGALTNGGSARGAFLTPDENQVFTFEAAAGQYINVRAEPISGPVDPILVLYDASVEMVLASDDDTGGGVIAELRNVRVPESGEYTLQVRTGGGVGEYEVRLSSAAVPAAVSSFVTPLPSLTPYPDIPTPTISAVESGYRLENHVPVRGNLQRAGSLDRYSINAAVTEGQTLTLTIGVSPAPGSAFRPQIQIFGPLGDLLVEMKAQDANAGGDAYIAALPVELTGVYVVYVTAEDGGSTGEYIISYGEGGFRHDVFRTNTESDRAYEGAIERPGLREVWYLYLPAGAAITAAALPRDSSLSPVIEFATLNNAILARSDASVPPAGSSRGAALIAQAVAPQAGLYLLRVNGAGGSSMGPYTLVWNYLNNAPTPTPILQTYTLLSFEDRVTQESDNCSSYYCFYSFQGQAGSQIRIRVNATTDPAFDPVAALLGPDGAVIAQGDDENGLNPLFTTQLPADGTYTVRVNGYGLAQGDFEVQVEAFLPPATPAP